MGILVLKRRPTESIVIDGKIRVTVLSVHGRDVRLGIDAPREMSVHRAEVAERIEREGRQGDQP